MRELVSSTLGSMESPAQDSFILLTGATGYIGGRLLRRLESRAFRLRCIARRPEFLRARAAPATEIVKGDVADPESLKAAMQGIDAAYFLVHSMGDAVNFEEKDRQAATFFGKAALEAGVKRIIYVGGLGDEKDGALSKHLRSRQEVGAILRASGVPVVEFRASIVIGSGSLSYEMIRALVERLPVMITPRWVGTLAQPIAISDLLDYLTAALDLPLTESRIIEIGGSEQVSYGGLMKEYARQRGLRRFMISIPFLTPRLSSLWLGLVTPLYARVGRKLIDSVRHSTLVRDDAALRLFSIRPKGVAEAVAVALRNEDREFVETHWSDALSANGIKQEWGGVRFGNRLVDSRTIAVSVPPATAFRAIERIGGKTGWYYGNWLWSIRGFLDVLAGGPGMRRGRRDPERLSAGDVVDCWRVESIEPGQRLRLVAEMKLPGRAWLEFEVAPSANGATIRQTATFDPLGLAGLMYWYGIFPLHGFVFAGMLRNLARSAEQSPRPIR